MGNLKYYTRYFLIADKKKKMILVVLIGNIKTYTRNIRVADEKQRKVLVKGIGEIKIYLEDSWPDILFSKVTACIGMKTSIPTNSDLL